MSEAKQSTNPGTAGSAEWKTVLQTERLLVRELGLEDFELLHGLCSDADVMKYVGNLLPYKETQTRQVILKCLRSYAHNGWGGWALHLLAGKEFVGYGGFEFVKERAMPELFYIFKPDYWGQGLASEFAIAATNFAFRELNMHKIGASFDPANEASMKVARKAGLEFSHEGLDEFNLPTIYYEISY